MSDPTTDSTSEPDVDWAVFGPAIIVVLLCSISLMVKPEGAAQLVAAGREAVMGNFLWVYLPAVPVAYMLYVKRDPFLRISSACDGALPKTGRARLKTIIDIFIVLGIAVEDIRSNNQSENSACLK